MENIFILGIDIAKLKFDVCLVTKTGEIIARGTFDNTMSGFKQLFRWLKKRKVVTLHACMEATGHYGEELCMHLHECGYQVSVINPQQIRHYAKSQFQRAKTDKLDAAIIADFGRTQKVRIWEPRPEEELVLRALVRRLNNLIENRTMETNRLKVAPVGSSVEQSIKKHISYLNDEIEALRKEIKAHIDKHPDLARQRDLLKTVPGIADHTAAMILAELPPVKRFNNSKQVAAFAGLTPRPQQSGTSLNRQGRLYKLGASSLRRCLYMPALSALRCNPRIQALAARMRLAGKHNMTIIVAAMRKLLTIAFGILKSGRPFEAAVTFKVQYN